MFPQKRIESSLAAVKGGLILFFCLLFTPAYAGLLDNTPPVISDVTATINSSDQPLTNGTAFPKNTDRITFTSGDPNYRPLLDWNGYHGVAKTFFSYKKSTASNWSTPTELLFNKDLGAATGRYGQWSWFYPLKVISGTGTFDVKIIAKDIVSNSTQEQYQIILGEPPDTTPPTISDITGGTTFSLNTDHLTWTSKDPGYSSTGKPDDSQGVTRSLYAYKKDSDKNWSQELELFFSSNNSDKQGKYGIWSWIYPWQIIKAAGTYKVKLIAIDKAGNRAEKECAITLTKPDTTPPVISDVTATISSSDRTLTNGTIFTITADRITFTSQDQDSPIAKTLYTYKYTTNANWSNLIELPPTQNLSDASGRYGQWSWFYPLRVLPGVGDFNIKIIAQDKAGNKTEKEYSIIIQTQSSGGGGTGGGGTSGGGSGGGGTGGGGTRGDDGGGTGGGTGGGGGGTGGSDTGQLVGPTGGQVLSSDGKAKVIIPDGALSESKTIEIIPIERQDLESASPNGKSLLSVVECKPYGLVFNKPVEIIYTLEQAEVPGTSVELGLYDAAQGRIIATGQTAAVSSDGYTVKFSLIHFSTYAAMKGLLSQGAPIGSGVQIPLPDMLTGAFSHAIPITVPPGRKGMQPALALTYRSSSPNSWTGTGFSLNPGFIVRSTRLGPPTYNDTQDTFYLITDAGTQELVYLVDNVYQAKVESGFTKFFKENDDSWKVVGKDGSVLRFGQTSESKEISSQGTFSWYLTKAIENNGNYIEYGYVQDQGKSYLSRIDYTGNENGISPTNSVEFFLESRDDAASSYISTSKVVTAKRLKEIQVKVNSDLVWQYVLDYGYSPDTNRSLLRSVIQKGSDEKSLPAQTLSYQQAK